MLDYQYYIHVKNKEVKKYLECCHRPDHLKHIQCFHWSLEDPFEDLLVMIIFDEHCPEMELA